jgi:hypothetical protein
MHMSLVNDTNNFTYHASVVHADLNNIIGPKFNQILHHHLHNVSFVLCAPRGINSPQEFFTGRDDAHHIENKVVGDQTPIIAY